jgi:RNA polymerase sigma-70 factor (ECF subfamily)
VTLVHDHETAEDLCQETFARVIQHWSKRDPNKNLVGWIYRISTNTAYDELRRRQHWGYDDVALLEAEDEVWSEKRVGDTLMIRAALAHLSQFELEALIMRDHEDRKLQEIATLTQCTVSAAKSRLHRARTHFRKVYDVSSS